ncbi:hypothetical protein RYX36_034979 [Vicia faba]
MRNLDEGNEVQLTLNQHSGSNKFIFGLIQLLIFIITRFI